MTEIKLPFLDEFKDKLLSRRKICTFRRKKHGKPGDTFTAFGHKFILLSVTPRAYHDIRDKFYKKEGCESPEQFEDIWRKIHPRMKIDDLWMGQLHMFKLLTLGGGPILCSEAHQCKYIGCRHIKPHQQMKGCDTGKCQQGYYVSCMPFSIDKPAQGKKGKGG